MSYQSALDRKIRLRQGFYRMSRPETCLAEWDEERRPKCQVCDGARGRRYFYGQDRAVVVDCPECNGGNLRRWQRAETDWSSRDT